MHNQHLATLAVSFLLVSVIGVGTLVWKYAPARISSERTHTAQNTFSYSPHIFKDLLGAPSADPIIKKPIHTNPGTDTQSSFAETIHDWENTIVSATTSQVIQPDTTSTTTAPPPPTSTFQATGGILRAVNTQFNAHEKSPSTQDVTDDIDEIINLYFATNQRTYTPIALPSIVTENTALHSYGNALADTLVSFNRSAGNQEDILGAHITERSNTSAQAVRQLATHYGTLSETIRTLTTPAIISTTHATLVEQFAQIGHRINTLADAHTDETLLESVMQYNRASELLAQELLVLIDTFNANGVRFQSAESGSIFTMPKFGQ